MKRSVGIVIVLVVAAIVIPVAAVSLASSSSGRPIIVFNSTVGVSGIFVGIKNPLRGINGGGLPWVIEKGQVKIAASGEFQVEVEGLVIDPNNATAIKSGLAGKNPLPTFKATLSCLDNTGAVTNVATEPVPATTTGDAEIDQVVTLPGMCFAPIVFVQSAGGAWFAVSGF